MTERVKIKCDDCKFVEDCVDYGWQDCKKFTPKPREPMTKLCDTCEYLKFCARSGIEDVGCDRYKRDTTTNEEWFCNLSTEEKAEWLSKHLRCSDCNIENRMCAGTYSGCKETLIKWLKEKHDA